MSASIRIDPAFLVSCSLPARVVRVVAIPWEDEGEQVVSPQEVHRTHVEVRPTGIAAHGDMCIVPKKRTTLIFNVNRGPSVQQTLYDAFVSSS